MSVKRGLAGRLALDSSALIELLLASERGRALKSLMVKGTVLPYVTRLSLAETAYVLCRKIGWKLAWRKVEALCESRYVVVSEDEEVYKEAARYKCWRALALADCFTLALAKCVGAPALFSTREGELEAEMERKPLDVEVVFMDEVLG